MCLENRTECEGTFSSCIEGTTLNNWSSKVSYTQLSWVPLSSSGCSCPYTKPGRCGNPFPQALRYLYEENTGVAFQHRHLVEQMDPLITRICCDREMCELLGEHRTGEANSYSGPKKPKAQENGDFNRTALLPKYYSSPAAVLFTVHCRTPGPPNSKAGIISCSFSIFLSFFPPPPALSPPPPSLQHREDCA